MAADAAAKTDTALLGETVLGSQILEMCTSLFCAFLTSKKYFKGSSTNFVGISVLLA
jgi:hypothetical protein